MLAVAEPPPESETKPPETEPTDPAQPTAEPGTPDEKMTAEVKGRLLAAALGIQMGDAAANVLHQIATTEPLHHDTCGTPVEARWWCPTCAQLVDPDDASDLRWA